MIINTLCLLPAFRPSHISLVHLSPAPLQNKIFLHLQYRSFINIGICHSVCSCFLYRNLDFIIALPRFPRIAFFILRKSWCCRHYLIVNIIYHDVIRSFFIRQMRRFINVSSYKKCNNK